MMRRQSRHTAAVALCAALSVPLWAGAQSRLTALSDVLPFESPDPSDCPKARITRKAAAPLPLERAVAAFDDAIEASVSPEAIRGLNASPAARDPHAATRIAVAALAAGRPLAAAALALRAHQAAPKDPSHLVNLAGVANYFGRYDEALAFANAAEALNPSAPAAGGMSGRAMLLTNKGNALVGLGRAKEAEAVLKEAIRLQPNLAEAYTNMGYALGQQNRCAEAARYLSAGRRRHPAEVLNPPKEQDPGKKPPETTAKESGAEKDEEPEEEFLPGDIAFDLSRGKRGLLPRVPVPVSLEEANATGKLISKLHKKLDEDTKAFLPGLQAAIDAQRRREAKERAMEDSGDVSQRLSAERSRRLRQALSRFARDGRTGDRHLDRLRQMMRDSLADRRRAERKASERKGEADNAALGKFVETQEKVCNPLSQEQARVCGLNQPGCEALRKKAQECAEKAKWEWEQAKCKAATKYLEEVAPAVRAYDNWLRSYFHESYLYATAVASYLGDRDNQSWARFKLRGYELDMARKALHAPAGGLPISDEELKTCKAAPPPALPLDVPANDVAFCAPGNSKVTAGVLQVLEVAMNCEQVDVTLSTPGFVNAFVQVSVDRSERARKAAEERARKAAREAARNERNPLGLLDFDRPLIERIGGTVTVFVGGGVRGEAGAVSTSGQAGAFITVDNYGTVIDAGGKTSSSAAVGAELGIVSVGVQTESGG